MLKRLLAAALLALAVTGCQPAPTPEAAPTPIPLAAVEGTLIPSTGAAVVAGRQVALCRVVDGSQSGPAACALMAPPAVTDARGRFTFEAVAPGSYLIVYASGLADFGAGLDRWAGRTLRPGDWAWVRDDYLGLGPEDAANVRPPASLPPGALFDRAAYGKHTLLFDGSPFVIAHTIAQEREAVTAQVIRIEALAGVALETIVPVFEPAPLDYAAMRAGVGALTRTEVALVDRALAARWQAFIDGDDSAFRDTDLAAIAALRAGALHEIGGAQISAVEEIGGDLVKRVGYSIVDVQSGELRLIGWLDAPSGDVVEARTDYRLNVRDDPGVWIETGQQGEQLYHYGFSYYRRWDQILPDPIITLIEDFYGEGAAHFWRHAADYQAAAASFGGDLLLVRWDASLLDRIAAWQPSTAPFVHLPDSGTVDIRRERFFEAITSGQVMIDEASITEFLRSDIVRNSAFNQAPDPQDVRDALLIPYRSGHLFNDLEAVIILDATYGGGNGPLTIAISDRLEQGFMVPRYQEKQVFVSQNELANVLLGYPGALNSRWPHELGHIVDFRAPQYTFTGPPAVGSRCEPVKYMMEYMWWVRRYPGDAPDWDWMPINSGLTLARLLAERFHNSGC